MRTLLLDSVDSTNSYLRDILEPQTAPFLAVLSLTQTQGRGRLERTWLSETGKSLTASLLLPEVTLPFQLGLVAAQALCQLLRETYSLPAQIKWPNDILIHNKKISGILSEKLANYVIVGIGINLNQKEFPSFLKELATSLYLETNSQSPIEEFFYTWCQIFEKSFALWQINPEHFILSQILPHLAWLNHSIFIDFQGNRTNIEGILSGLSPEGFLLVKTKENKVHTITTGDLKLWLQA